MTYLNNLEMTLGDQTGQSLKITGGKDLLFNGKDEFETLVFC